ATFIRTWVILVVCAIVITLKGLWQFPSALTAKSSSFLILSGCATGLSWLCYYRALQLGQASRVAPVDKLSVVLVMLFSAIFLSEKITWQVGFWGGLITFGAVLIVLG
ncbi:MAG: EamA family transporter, partial [Proteobacteria bacterium]